MPRNTKLLYYYMYFSLLFIFKFKQALGKKKKKVGIIFEQCSFDYIKHDSKYSMAFNKLLFSNLVHKGKIKVILRYI